jgi:hypothetical protein
MTAIRSRFLLLSLTSVLFAAPAHAGTLSGAVINRTTGKPEPNVALDLLSPTAGMIELASTKSDAQGHFSVTKDSIGMAPILVRATFHDVSFNTFAPPGRPNLEVDVFDITEDPKTITVPSHVIIFDPRDNKLIGAEEYSVENVSQPPVAYFRAEGNFDFSIPANATIGQVNTTTSSGMAVTQASIEKGKGRFAIAYPFRPGQTNVRLSYELPYTNNSASLQMPATHSGAKLLVVVPPGVSVTGDGLVAAGQEQGMMVYTHEPLAVNGVLSLSLSGVPTAAPASADQGQPPEGNSRRGPEVIAAPSRLNDLKWYIFAGLAALFGMGAVLLSRKQIVLPVVREALDADLTSARLSPASKPKKAPPVSAPPAPPVTVSAEVNQHVAHSMDALKEQIFRLELRRQAGTISEDDYAREKARVDRLLRDLVQG